MIRAPKGELETRESWERRFQAAGPSERVWMSASQNDVKRLLRALADGGGLDFVGARGVAAWGEVAGFSGSLGLTGDRLGCLAALLAAGADVNEQSPGAGSALHIAAARRNDSEARFLIERGARLESQSPDGSTPLIAGVKGARGGWVGSIDALRVCEALLEAGANPNAVDMEGNSSLIWAARKGECAIGRALLAAGADWRRSNRAGESALDACRAGAERSLLEAELIALCELEALGETTGQPEPGQGARFL